MSHTHLRRSVLAAAATALAVSACGGRLEVADCGPTADLCAAGQVCCPHGYACGTGTDECALGECCGTTASRASLNVHYQPLPPPTFDGTSGTNAAGAGSVTGAPGGGSTAGGGSASGVTGHD